MRLTVSLKLKPTPDQAEALLATIETCNIAANFVSEVAWVNKVFGQYKLHRLAYRELREKFGLTAQATVHVIKKVADAYKLDRKRKREFRLRGAITYDDRILRYYPSEVSIWTVKGRMRVPFACGPRQAQLLKYRQGESDLLYRDGEFYLFATVNVEEPPPYLPIDWLGVDLGIVNLATDSDGESYSGAQANGLRKRYAKLRSKLQKKAAEKRKSGKRPKSIIRLLKKRSKKEHHFATNVNHVIAKRLVAKAKGTGRGIALEDLTGIRNRITVSKAQRRTQHSWAFRQLRAFIEYKAKLAGVPVTVVDPRNTSRTCPVCGCVDKRNRPDQAHFCCTSCGFAGPADVIAAENIRRAAVNRPNAATA